MRMISWRYKSSQVLWKDLQIECRLLGWLSDCTVARSIIGNVHNFMQTTMMIRWRLNCLSFDPLSLLVSEWKFWYLNNCHFTSSPPCSPIDDFSITESDRLCHVNLSPSCSSIALQNQTAYILWLPSPLSSPGILLGVARSECPLNAHWMESSNCNNMVSDRATTATIEWANS